MTFTLASAVSVWNEERDKLCGIVVARAYDPHKAYMIPIDAIVHNFARLVRLDEDPHLVEILIDRAYHVPQMIITRQGTN